MPYPTLPTQCQLHRVVAIAILSVSLLTSACARITVKPNADTTLNRPPDYEESIPYYWFGLMGKRHFDVSKICDGGEAEQIRAEYTLSDLSIAAKTLFFYFPKTAKIWCKKPKSPLY